MTDVVNVDFCSAVIRDMLAAHARARPRMRWVVADVTALPRAHPLLRPASAHLALDKGALDALHSDADDAVAGGAAAAGLVAAVKRLVRAGGAYAAVSLCQRHVLTFLLAAFRTPEYSIAIHAVPPPPDMAGAALQPMLVVATRRADGAERGAAAPPVALHAPPSLTAPNGDQLDDVAAVVAAENGARARGDEAAGAAPVPPPPPPDPFATLQPGRTLTLTLPRGSATPAYDATVVDAALPPAGPPTAAIFVVPQGREHEWLFATPAGAADVAAQVGAGRVVLVALRRGAAAPATVAALTSALSPLVASLAPAALRGVPGAVPVVTLAEGLGTRAAVAAVASALDGGGALLVEDVGPPPGAPPTTSGLRRLVFGGAVALVQSEAVLEVGKKGKGGARARPTPSLADHLPAAYHSAVLVGLALGGVIGESVPAEPRTALVVGLGAGGLPTFLAAHTPLAVATVELDPAVVAVARAHFGFVEWVPGQGPGGGGGSLAVEVGDGVAAVASAAAAPRAPPLAAIVVDAGGADATDAMSCPPPPFATQEFADGAAAALRRGGGGALVVNAVSRDPAPVAALTAVLASSFDAVAEIDVPDDVNRVLVAVVGGKGGWCGADGAALAAALRAAGVPADPAAAVGGPGLAELGDLVVVRKDWA